MKELYKWLQEETLKSLQILDNKTVQDELPNETKNSTKVYLINCHNTLENLIQVLDGNNLDIIKTIALIAKFKGLEAENDEEEVFEQMTMEMMSRSGLEIK